MAVYYKPQSPIQSGEDFIYPITTADQVKVDKDTRLNAVGVYLKNIDNSTDTTVYGNNATTLGGVSAEDYALKTDTAPDSSKLGGKAPEYYTWTNNLLKNSNFASKYLINLNGKTEYTDIGDVFSGWIKESTSILTLNDDYITIDNSANNNTEQIIYTDRKEEAEKLIGKTVTLAICTSEGDIHCASGIVSTDTPCAVIFTENFDCALQFFSNSGSYQLTRLIIKAGKTTSIKWIVLYEGAYTAETLPQPQWLHPRLEMIRMGLPTQPRNLLDNSDFTNLVNQRGKTSYSGGYGIDRWKQWSNSHTTTINDNSISISIIQQYIGSNIDFDKIYTIAAKKVDGSILCEIGTFNGKLNKNGLRIDYDTNTDGTKKPYVAINKAGDYVWAALYEGRYTADTLPPYVPKGYAAELAECQRYYLPVSDYWNMGVVLTGTGYICLNIPTNIKMRMSPTPIISNPRMYHPTYDWVDLTYRTLEWHAPFYRIIFNWPSNIQASISDIVLINGVTGLSADL